MPISTNTAATPLYGIQVGNALNASITRNSFALQTSATTALLPFPGNRVQYIQCNRNNITQVNATNTGGYGGRGITIGTGSPAVT